MRLFLLLFLMAGVSQASWIHISFAYDRSVPYEARFKAKRTIDMTNAQEGGQVVGSIPGGSGGIILQYCAPEFNFGDWHFNGDSKRLGILAKRVCQVNFNGTIGYVKGKDLQFD